MAVKRMQRALDEFQIEGIKVTVPFYRQVFKDSGFIAGDIDTHFLERIENRDT
jgi:acetyl-CoA carboxylase biotin carboxylase subunit